MRAIESDTQHISPGRRRRFPAARDANRHPWAAEQRFLIEMVVFFIVAMLAVLGLLGATLLLLASADADPPAY